MHKGLSVIDLDVHTVKGVRFDVPQGRCAGVTGPSGSGKTLILRALADLDPHQGEVRLNGVPATDVAAPDWRRRVGLLPAETAWWHDTVGPHFREVPEDGLAQMGFDLSVMQWQVSRLSSGERQRLGLLRMLANRPEALLLDEPTANLDGQSVHRVETLLADYRRRHQPVVVWVGHDRDLLERNCDALHIIRDGRLVTEPVHRAADWTDP